MTIDVERDDYLRTPGRRAQWIIGPFEFYASTADEGWIAFGWNVGRWIVSWEWRGRAVPPSKGA